MIISMFQNNFDYMTKVILIISKSFPTIQKCKEIPQYILSLFKLFTTRYTIFEYAD